MKNCIKKIFQKFRNKILREKSVEDLIKRGLIIGKNFNIQKECILDPSHCWLIEIGDEVTLAPRVHILAHDASTKRELGYTKIGKVKIGNNVFIGANTTVLPNIKIGDNVIIGANSLVSKNIEDNSVVAGNPARKIMTYQEYINKNREKMKKAPIFGEEYTLRNKKITKEMKEKMKKELEGCVGYIV